MFNKKRTSVVVKDNKASSITERLFIGTLGVNCVEYTKRMIASVQTNCESVKLVYIDNGSRQENVDTIKNWSNQNDDIDEFAVGFNGWNAGVSFGWNQLIRIALEWGATKILICNNDIVFGPNTIDGLVESFRKIKDEVPETVMVTAANKTKNPSNLSSIKPVWNYHEHPDFSCFMIEPQTVEKVGMFCEDYKPAFFEDNDMHWRILMMGYKAFTSDMAPYSHIASRTRFENPNIVDHYKFRGSKIAFFRNMLTDSVEQQIAVDRYNHWIAKNPSIRHPSHTDVISLAVKDGLVSKELISRISKMTVNNID